MSGGAPALVDDTRPPRTTHWQKSQPLENDQRPCSRKPPSTRSTVPVGDRAEETWVLASSCQTSSCAWGGNRPSCQLCTPTTVRHQALEPQTVPISMPA